MLVQQCQAVKTVVLNTPLQAMACQRRNEKLYHYNIYLNHDRDIPYTGINNLLSQLPRPLIVMGEFNGHYIFWGDTQTDQRGQVIERLSLNCDVGFLKTGCHTYFHKQTNTTSAIDLALVPSNVIVDFEWIVDEDLHIAIIFLFTYSI